jgi:hypothetical protein
MGYILAGQKLLKKFQINNLLNNFNYWTYFIYMCAERNLQRLFYYLAFELKTLFFKYFVGKFFSILSILILLIIFMITICIFFILKYFYSGRSFEAIYENLKNHGKLGFIYMTVTFSLRSWLLGFVHMLIQNPYRLKCGAKFFLQC